jgi:diphthine synthase
MALYLIGMGISLDFTLEGIRIAKQCKEVYLEGYTGALSADISKIIQKTLGRDIIPLEREDVESNVLLEKAGRKDIVLLSAGDPLTATTHISLLLEAKKRGIKTKVIHNSSVYTAAAGKAGLQIYRFGKTATLVNQRTNYKPTSSLDIIRSNLGANMHTLVLLDTEPQPMEAKTALEMLSEFENAVVLSRLGYKDEKITFGKPLELTNKNLGKSPFTIIIPAKLHVVEEEYLELLLADLDVQNHQSKRK